MRQRRAPAVVPRQPPAKAADSRAPRPRSGRGAERELARVLGRIETLQASIHALEQTLSDPDLFRRDAAAFAAGSAQLAEQRAELEAAEQRWLELETEIEGAI
jgi:ATP-binding cassette subfamily F protein uup